ncbi:receptor-like protein EIX1 [Helianthus annuus]|nr:receptor-like protein EIX1 [Helianthus annuus]
MACFEHERLALLKFKHSVRDTHDMLSSWVGNDCCQWERVMCDGVTGHVERLHLRASLLDDDDCLVSKEVSTSLGELRHLNHLDLSGNDIQGSQIPEFIGSLKQLNYLNLSHAYLSGIIPHRLGNLSNLKNLDLSSNTQLMSLDMAWISGLSSLVYNDLSFVLLSGAKNLHMVFYMVPSLKELSLSNCGLSNVDLGSLHNSSITLSNIKHLDLSKNSLKGQLPHFFQNMTSLQSLDLSFFDFPVTWNFANFLRMIPSLLELHLSLCNLDESNLSNTHHNFTTLSNIEHLDLSQNFLSLRFPSIIANMTSLRVLNLSGSTFNSWIPIMPNLLELDLSSNHFVKFEDVGIWRQCQLKQLSVASNDFLMELTDSPTNVSECSQYDLEWLNLADSVNGTIPESLVKMTNLRGLHLSGKLTGPLPRSLGSLSFLQVLDMPRNKLKGSIPESMGMLRLLQALDLSFNELTGPIPTFLGKLTKLDLSFNYLNGSIPEPSVALRYLHLENNQLTGPIPASLGKLTKLSSLDVSNNSLDGVVFEAHFANLSMLKYLNAASNSKLTFNVSRTWLPPFQLITIDLSSCKIMNGFPQWLRNQKKLLSLVLPNANISGPLPAWLRKIPIIRIINLSHNNLSGPLTNLPSGATYNVNPSMGTYNSYNLPRLFLQNNLFNESIPMSLCNMTDLEYLNLSRNRLTGNIPSCLKNLQNLRVMILSSNGLNGVIPSSIGHVSSLVLLKMNDNNFSGELPQEFGNLSSLSILDLGDNAFCGKIPEWIGDKVQWLQVFRLHKNNFTGGIPQSLCKITNLQILDFAHNNLTGTIPHCLGELYGMAKSYGGLAIDYFSPTELVSFEAGVIQVMKGAAREYDKTLQFVINMDLSSNKLFGEIPIELTALWALVGLNLSNNHLTGNIPYIIGNMKSLNSLDLSTNELSGPIPPSIGELTFLSYLNLSNNNLVGRIPTGNQLQTLIDPSIYAGNKDLCGAPLPTNCSYHEDPTATPNTEYEAAEPNKVWFYVNITCGFATGFWGVIVVLVLKKQWRHNLFMYAEETVDKIYIVVMVRFKKMKRGREAI